MNVYTVEIKRTGYVTLQIEAATPDEAEAKAWHEIQTGDYDQGANWELESIEKQENAA